MPHLVPRAFLALLLSLSAATAEPSSPPVSVPEPSSAYGSSIPFTSVDPAAYAEWCAGVETALPPAEAGQNGKFPRWAVWTDKTMPWMYGVPFGAVGKSAGPRYLRLGFKEPIAVGTLMVRGGGRPSVLKSSAAYPGAMAEDAQWIPGQRLTKDGQITTDEIERDDVALWIFPPGTSTRAIRFAHTPDLSDTKYEGWLGGFVVLKERVQNVAPRALAYASSASDRAAKLNNETQEQGGVWANRDDKEDKLPEGASPVSPEHPEWLMLAWPQPVKVSSLATLWTGFGAAEVETYAGPADRHPRDAREGDWKRVAQYTNLQSGNLIPIWPNRLDLGGEITARALRVRLTAPTKQGVHMKLEGGSRVWLGELMALQSLGDAPLKAQPQLAADSNAPKPPVPIRFKLKEPSFVTLVIENKEGFRFRNLISETWFPAGENTAWWDGLDDLGRDLDAANHGLYKIPARLMDPGEYRVRGLVRGAIEPHYEFSIYAPGNPPWSTADHTGAWLANHTPPMAAAFIPAEKSPLGEPTVALGCYVTEGPDGMAWVDLDGHKRGGKKWIGGVWTAAPYIASDTGTKAVASVSAYVASVWETGKKSGEGELRINAIGKGDDKQVLLYPMGTLGASDHDKGAEIGGLAVRDGVAVVSLTRKNQLLVVDVAAGKVVSTIPVQSPLGVAIDHQGRVDVLSGTQLLQFASTSATTSRPLIATGLEAPIGITLDERDAIYLSDRGASHQVKLFTPEGKFLRAIGEPGAPKAGTYNPLHLNNPAGLALDSRQQLWVTENDYLPKRVSVWSLDGKLIQAFYGPGKYGGGGSLDPRDNTKFYYADEGSRGTLEFRVDWQKGAAEVTSVIYRADAGTLKLPTREAGPETALYHGEQRYFTNCYNNNPTNGHGTATLFIDRGGVAKPVAIMGRVEGWELLAGADFKSRLPEGVDLTSKGDKKEAYFAWVDANEDGQVQPAEVTMVKGQGSGIGVMADLSFVFARANGQTVRFAPTGFSSTGVPSYDLTKPEVLANGVAGPGSSGGNQALAGPDGWVAVTLGMAPFEQYSISGAKNGVPLWSYPNLWPGLHASHKAPRPTEPGEIIGPTRLLGGLLTPKGSEVGPLWAVNSNHGMVYLFTYDGLFVATLFKDMRGGKRWAMPMAERNMRLDDLTLGEENFWPTISQTPEGQVYMVDGARSSLVRLDGLQTLRRLPEMPLNFTKADLAKCRTFLLESEAARQRAQGTGKLEVALRSTAPVVDGKADDWQGADFVDIDKRGVKANFNANTKPYDVTGALAVAGDRLYAIYRCEDEKLLQNSAEMPVAPFKTGGALDLMLGVNPAAPANRAAPAAGDLRLIVTLKKGKPWALLYRAVVPGTKPADKVPFSSPNSTITFDQVQDVSDQIQFAAGEGVYEFSLPLSTLGLQLKPDLAIKGDLGILRGSGGQTNARIYWANKATAIVSDVPSEAMLTPSLWGTVHFSPAK